MNWRTSTYSINNGDCVEVGTGIAVRDTKNREAGMLMFPAEAWREFTGALKH
jgi:uncharacterized protein DUF397